MATLIFDDIERDRSGVPAHTESHFSYLNRSSRTEAELVRQLLEDWISRYPKSDRAGMISRLRSQIDDAHISAFFELALHELLLRTNHKIIAIEPELKHTSKRPDFLVESANGERFYLEAVIATGRSKDETSAQNRLNQAIEEIELRQVPLHFLDLSVEGKPSAPISLKKLRTKLDQWIAKLPEGKDAADVEPFRYEEHGARFEVGAIPRHRKRLDVPTRAVGVHWMGVHMLKPGESIYAPVNAKASRYGKLDAPYVVAVNALGTHEREETALDALLGSPCAVITQYADGRSEVRADRNPDGVWCGPRGKRNTGLSAILSTERLNPWSVAQRKGRIIRNPWARHTLPETGFRLDSLNPIDGVFKKTEGENFANIFELPPEWPEE